MANSDWASEAFGTIDKSKWVSDVAVAQQRRAITRLDVDDLIEEAEFVLRVIDTNECPACERWFYGDGLQCEHHGEEAQQAQQRRLGL